jgi:ubiquinone/menaquinone biosynthesis C-methylase UbiE
MTGDEGEVTRVQRTKEEAIENYDRLSNWYDLLAGQSEAKYKSAGLQMLAAQAGEKVLEIGFGTGHSLISLAQSVEGRGAVYGIDLSAGMCQVTEVRLQEQGLLDRVYLTRGDAARLPYGVSQFDAMFMSFTLELFDTPEIPVVLEECRRTLAQDGRLCVVSLAKKDSANVPVKIYEWAHQLLPKFIDCRPIFVSRVVEQAGLEILSARQEVMWGLPVEIVLAKKIS